MFTGVQSEVCVLASVTDAMDRGYRVVLVSDAAAGAREAGHEAVMRHVYPRFDSQVEIATSAQVLTAWPARRTRAVPAGT